VPHRGPAGGSLFAVEAGDMQALVDDMQALVGGIQAPVGDMQALAGDMQAGQEGGRAQGPGQEHNLLQRRSGRCSCSHRCQGTR